MADNTPKNAKGGQGSFLETAGAFGQGLLNGPTFGLVNKVEAGAISAFSDVTYHDKLMEIKAFEDKHPTAYKAGEITGDAAAIAVPGGMLVNGLRAAEISMVSVRGGMLAAGVAKGAVAGAVTLGVFEVATAHANQQHFVPPATPKVAAKVAHAIQVASK